MGHLVFLADDDPLIRSLVTSRLSVDGYQVQCACDGEDALLQLTGLSPSLIILDVDMPGLSGLEVARRVARAPQLSTVPIMILTASANAQVVKTAAELRLACYVLKPFNPDQLAKRVRKLAPPPPGQVGGKDREVFELDI